MSAPPHTPSSFARRPLVCLAGLVGLTVLTVVVGGCGEGNPGADPPADAFAFPAGLLLDPTADPDGPARWLIVTNANSDRRYNAGSLLAVDLDAFWAAYEDSDNIRSAGERVTDDRPCRRVANLPQVIECLEEPFVEADATVHFGNFPGPTVAWVHSPDAATLMIPVRGDPSVTYVEWSKAGDGTPNFDCFTADEPRDPEAIGGLRCRDDYRLRFLRNDPDSPRLSREPFRILIGDEPLEPTDPGVDTPSRLAYVSHQGDSDVTVLALEGLKIGGDGRPAIVHQANLLAISGAPNSFQGGFGLAQRPCEVDAAPNATLNCQRPLIYASMRWAAQVRTITAITHTPIGDQNCVGPDDLDKPKGISCEPQAEPVRNLAVGQLSTADVPASPSRPILADIGFSRAGDELYVVQSNPGAILRIDTSIGSDGETVDVPAGQVEVCAQPTTFAIYDGADPDSGGDGSDQGQYGIVTCYRSGEVFIVDLASLKVVGLSRAGIGPDSIAADVAREVVYVANSLDATVSVISMSPTDPARFTQIARIGIQEPYVQ